ncbi:3'5'-cyclic nucleotide phosphodiesterase family protein [Trichomonas vaginalis G3]|uniref:3'5'-cyclic nucleotide phosphodiesterase family protein n=1 Tax=Trichomonas vaginalis (strain ATCC PRA-98 / G3) TaxID=412133 RepID=A2DV74_TRIV3|nr:cyclic nucleotide phosphodiesterase family [Trichomonas vaginalis G3]EAY15670.1 3'5'-cyclic nucleotide phosphodiesterase family protein [Trichomonas vaginalis G3]KAI5504517.1 cyclic nucleotide phosphodiesterase family [Trichomonas vaginalis G3]|eukprot:XP_001327893.1 3'5'-cyclic nucleotide phosphodiesterase family protein [Trichomonas vaginalis G3]
MKVVKQIGKAGEKKSLVNELISLNPISSVVITETHPLVNLYDDTNPPPQPVDQFAPYLSRKISRKRQEKISKIKGPQTKESPTFALTAQRQSRAHTAIGGRYQPDNALPPIGLFDDRQKTQQNSQNLQLHLKMEETFDKIASSSASVALHKLVESTLQIYFLADQVLYFHDISSVKVLYCPSNTTSFPHGTGIAGYTQFTREIVNIPIASEYASFNPLNESAQIKKDSHILAFPLFDFSNNVKAVIEVIRSKESPLFNDNDIKFAEYFQNKCKLYSRWLFQPLLDDTFASELIQTCRLKQFVQLITEKLTKLFFCRRAEIWRYNSQDNQFVTFTMSSDYPVTVPLSELGIAGYSLRHEVPISCVTARIHSAYVEKADGNGDYSVLSIPVRDPDNRYVYAVVLRGKRNPQFFTDNDEKILSRIIPYIIASLNSAFVAEKNHHDLEDAIRQQKRLRSLLEVAEILSGDLQIDSLIPKIMSRACDLVKADRCSLFMANEAKDKLITTFTGGLKNAIEIPFNAGIVGYTATTGEILNIKDAYEDPRFNRATDLKTGYRTLTLLCVPIFDHKGNVRGVTEMINKLDGTFTEEDVKLIQIFNVFTGISLENAQLYRASIELSVQLKTFMDLSVSVTQTQAIKKILEDIIKNTRQVIGAVTAELYLYEDEGISAKPVVVDEDIQTKVELYEEKKKKEDDENSLGVKKLIIKRLMAGKDSNEEEVNSNESMKKQVIEKALNIKTGIVENDEKQPEKSLMVTPILGSDKSTYGVVLMQWKKNQQKFSIDDLRLLESYSVFLSISLERTKLKSIAQMNSSEVEIQTWLNPNERKLTQIPQKLSLTNEESNSIFSFDYNPEIYKGIGFFKIVFSLFNYFTLLDEFKINAETMYHFLHNLRDSYNVVPYHNWMHAVDVTQFIAVLIIKTGLDKILTKFEILSLLVASLCHDANHDGFSNTYNINAQTPLGILFKNQSVMETHHCSVSIGIITREECNIFSHIKEKEIQRMWQYFIELILSTDMAQHFIFIDRAKKLLGSHSEWFTSQENRLLVMCLLIKIADISNVARKFETADRWCAILCEEFFRQGDLERANGMAYSSPMNDREHLNKAASQLGFYKNVCLPLFDIASQIVGGMDDVVEQVRSNMKVWEERK